jgi:hypothetical protein
MEVAASMESERRILLPDIPSEGLKHDWELLDRYQAFSAELLRMSLVGIGAVGFLVTALAGKESLLKISGVPLTSRWSMAVSLLALGPLLICVGIAATLNQDRTAIHHNGLAGAEPLLHQKQIGLCNVMSFADSSHRQTLANTFKELLPFR